MEILEDKQNIFLNRREVKIVVEAEKTPTYEDAINILSEQFRADKNLIVVKHVKGRFGRDTFLITAFIYKSEEDKERYEPKKKEKKKESESVQKQPSQPISSQEKTPQET
jgi:ribosomal protein S24E